MRNIFIINDSLKNKISYYHLALFLIILPFDRFYSELVVISFIFHILIHSNKEKLRLVLAWQNLILTSVFLLSVFGMIWSHDMKEALKDTERQLTILLFPLGLSASGLGLFQYKKKLLVLFGFTCILTILYLYADAIHVILYYNLPVKSLFSSAFINHNFSAPIGIHATYLSIYAALSMASFLCFLFKEKNKVNRILYAAGIAILLAGLLQLTSKSVLIGTIIFVITGFSFFMAAGIRRTMFIVIALAAALMTLLSITQVGSFKKRYLSELKGDLTEASINNEILDPRIMRWKVAWQLVEHSPIFGYGSGSEKRLLMEKYFENKLYDSYVHKLNAHNQYLSFLLKTGIVGLIVFLITLYAGFVAAWRNRDFVFTSFMILITVVSFSENILDVNKGIFFYAFFFSFFVLSGKPFDKIFRLIKRNWPMNS
jgi:O-antigen ligase